MFVQVQAECFPPTTPHPREKFKRYLGRRLKQSLIWTSIPDDSRVSYKNLSVMEDTWLIFIQSNLADFFNGTGINPSIFYRRKGKIQLYQNLDCKYQVDFFLSAFLDLSLALNTLVAGSREPLEKKLVSWKRATRAMPVADANKLLVLLWGKLWVGQREWRPFLSTILAKSSLARLPSLEQEIPLGTAGLNWALVFLTWADWQDWFSDLVKRTFLFCVLLPCLCKHSRAAVC